MNIKKIGAIAAGTAMIGATLAGGAAASGHTYTDSDGTTIPENFFVKDGELNTQIVVGSQAAPADVKAASDVGLAIGNKLYTEEEVTPDLDTVTIKEDTTDDSYKIPVYSNLYERNGNFVEPDTSGDDREDLTGDNWYVFGEGEEDGSIDSGEDWTTDDLEGGFNGATYNDNNLDGDIEFTFEMSDFVDSYDDEEEETTAVDADLTVDFSEFEVYDDEDDSDDFSNDDVPTTSADFEVDDGGMGLHINFTGEPDVGEVWGEDEPDYSTLEVDDKFTLLGKTYAVENVTNDNVFEVASDVQTKWGSTGETLDFSGYKITVLDVDTNSDKVLFELESPDGDTVTDTLDTEDDPSDSYWDDDVFVEATNVFAGIEGTNQAEFEVAQDKQDLEEETDDWPVEDWDVNGIGYVDGEDSVDVLNVTYSGNEISGGSLELLDYFTVEYEYNEWNADVDLDGDGDIGDGEDLYAFESWVEFKPPEDSETHELEMGDSFGDVYSVEGATAEDVMSKSLNPVTESMTVMDEDVDLDNVDSNYILVGGPVANSVTEALVDAGVSEVNWEESEGDLEYVEYGDYDHLIVAGMNRDATQDAAVTLLEKLAE